MDAVKFLMYCKEFCHNQPNCIGCPVSCFGNCVFPESEDEAKGIINKIEQWKNERPVNTRQSEFLKMFPDAKISGGYLFCPQNVNWRYVPAEGCDPNRCRDCCREFWMQEVK